MEKIEHCCFCASPSFDNYRNVVGEKLSFFKTIDGVICSDCREFLADHRYISREYFDFELDNFLSSNKSILFSYSGSLNDTSTLFLLLKECQKRSIRLDVFTIDSGFKGARVYGNVNSIINFLNLKRNHFYFSLSDLVNHNKEIVDLTGNPMTAPDFYRYCWGRDIFPYGKVLDSIIRNAYREVIRSQGYDAVFTGGDTPKINDLGRYSIFWEDEDVLTVRGSYAFNLSMENSRQLLGENKIPWIDPMCGGYRTDCLVPGAFLFRSLKGKKIVIKEEFYDSNPDIFYYLIERTRFGAFNRLSSIRMMRVVDIGDAESYCELKEIMDK